MLPNDQKWIIKGCFGTVISRRFEIFKTECCFQVGLLQKLREKVYKTTKKNLSFQNLDLLKAIAQSILGQIQHPGTVFETSDQGL